MGVVLKFKPVRSDLELLSEALVQQRERELTVLRGRLTSDYPETPVSRVN